MMFSLLAPTAFATDNGAVASAVDYSKVPKLLITELVPDSSNVSGSDAYEFIEVYNNTNKTLDFKDYNLVYRFPGSETVWSIYKNSNPNGSVSIPAQASVVFWVMNSVNKTLTEADFNNNYHTSLVENVSLFRVDGGGGMINSPPADKPRDLVVKDKSGTEISIASYQNDDQTKENMGIFYRYPTDGTIKMVMYGSGADAAPAAATPGIVDAIQVPPVPLNASEPPVVHHKPVTQADQKNDLVISAQIANAEPNETVTASVYYQAASQSTYQSTNMMATGNSQYQAIIPKSALSESQLRYYIQAQDSFNTVSTSVYNVDITFDNFDYSKVPPLLVSEVVPDSANVGDMDGYEYIEIYNNTDQPVNFKDYIIRYRYTDSGPDDDLYWAADKRDVVIPSKGTLVFWIINSQNTNSTVADFNANYGTNLVEGKDIVRIYSDGMANGSKRGLVIATNSGTEIAAAYYGPGDAKENKGILYKYPVDGSKIMTKYSSATAAATPGAVDIVQVPGQVVKVTPDTGIPTLTDITRFAEIDQSKDLEIIGDAKDDKAVKTVILYYKTDNQSDYAKKYLTESFADTFYHYKVYSPELIGRQYLDYYFAVSDGTNEITSGKKRVAITGGSDRSNLRLNVKDGDILAKTKVIKGTGESLDPDSLKFTIDGQEVTQPAYHAIEHNAYFAFDVSGVDYYFKNAVTQGEEILYTFQDPIPTYATLSIPFQADRLKEGSNIISIRAGSKSSPFDDRAAENKDDFDVKNVRLVFADGTVIYDAKYANPSKVIKMGDSSGKFPVVDFNFVIPSTLLASKALAWNTASMSDGDHQISLSNGTMSTVTANVKVDNTAPTISPTVEEGKMYRGPFTVDAAISDALSGVDKVEVTLDGKAIELPYATSSAKMPGGTHVFNVKATDKVGNSATATINFQVPNENPNLPELVAPGDGASGVDRHASLTVKVSDPMNDEMKVSFYKGFKYDTGTPGHFAGYRGAADTEPPKMEKPEGETAFAQDDYRKISAPDGEYLVDDSVEKFPYQRFEVTLDDSVKSSDQVEINWKGKSLQGRKVSLYAWSPTQQEWKQLQTTIAGSEDFELQGSVTAGDFAKDHKILVMVQDEIAATQSSESPTPADYDFSFVWMSDTQYYAKSYPYIYQDIVKWIADHKEDNKIKYVIHTGDIVDNADQEYQWIEADKDMKVLEDAKIPYGVLAGNHDVGHQNNDYSYYSQWFGEDRFKNQPTYGESYDNNRGHYDLVSSNGNDFIVVYMGWGFGDKEIDWINDVLKQYPNRKAILNFHEYMLVSNNRAPMADKVFERVVKPNKNVIAALSGHYHDAQLKVDAIDDNGDGQPDRNVYQMLADYQGAPEGGLGYIRLMQFDMAHGKINMKTFSPYLNDYNYYDPQQYPGKDEFSISLDLQPVIKRVATDYLGVKVYSSQPIGSVEHVESGKQATVPWSNLASNAIYQWYSVAEDAYGGKKLSDIWRFTTGTTNTEGHGGKDSGSSSGSVISPPANAEIIQSASGGTITLDGVKIVVPAGAKTSDIRVTVDKITDGSKLPMDSTSTLISGVFEIKKDKDGPFSKSVQITLPFEKNKVDFDRSLVSIYWLNEETGKWIELDNPQVDKVNGTVTGSVNHFTKFAVLATVKKEEPKPVPGPGLVDPSDIKGHWAENNIRDMIRMGAVNGYPDGTLKPDNTITRAEFVAIVVKSMKLGEQDGKVFADTGNHWAKNLIATAAAHGIITGYTDSTFGPDDSITREQMAEIIVRAAHLNPVTVGTTFVDNSDISEWAQAAMAAVTSKGFMNGYQDGTIRPQGITTRAEALTVILRALAGKTR